VSAPIDQAFPKIAIQHDCCNVELSYNVEVPNSLWTVTLHWKGFARSGIPCIFGFGDTPAAALTKALANMRADREPYVAAHLGSDTTVDFEVAA
jgi:hypothetical protein